MFNEMSLVIVGNGYYKHDRGGEVQCTHVRTRVIRENILIFKKSVDNDS